MDADVTRNCRNQSLGQNTKAADDFRRKAFQDTVERKRGVILVNFCALVKFSPAYSLYVRVVCIRQIGTRADVEDRETSYRTAAILGRSSSRKSSEYISIMTGTGRNRNSRSVATTRAMYVRMYVQTKDPVCHWLGEPVCLS